MPEKDRKILEKYARENPWGLAVSLDLTSCNPKFIKSKAKIRQFVRKLCQLLKLKRYGETQIIKFGTDPRVHGFSMTQLIETSLISGHFANLTGSAYLDIFSCQAFPPYQAAYFSKDFFAAKDMRIKINFRY